MLVKHKTFTNRTIADKMFYYCTTSNDTCMLTAINIYETKHRNSTDNQRSQGMTILKMTTTEQIFKHTQNYSVLLLPSIFPQLINEILWVRPVPK